MLFNHKFNGVSIPQASEDMVLSGTKVPKGYANATLMCKANEKRWAKYREFSKTQPFLDALERVSPGEGHTHIINITEGANENRGTWVSPCVCENLIEWLSQTKACEILPEKIISDRLKEELNGIREVKVPGGRIDLLTESQIIEVKNVKKCAEALAISP